jgi:hypothetical protein
MADFIGELPSLLGLVVGAGILTFMTKEFLVEPMHSKGESLLSKVV